MIRQWSVEIAGQEEELSIEPLETGRFRLTRGNRSYEVDARRIGGHGASSTWSVLPVGGGAVYQVDVEGRGGDLSVTHANLTVPLKLLSPLQRSMGRAAQSQRRGAAMVKSPMPGKVVRLLVKAGDELKAGQGVAVVEAMKMENELRAPKDGKVQEVRVREGQAVEAGETLVTLE
jgi:biotin carboxyl carrier protein